MSRQEKLKAGLEGLFSTPRRRDQPPEPVTSDAEGPEAPAPAIEQTGFSVPGRAEAVDSTTEERPTVTAAQPGVISTVRQANHDNGGGRIVENEGRRKEGASWLWLWGGFALSVTTLCSVVLLVLLLISASLNAYLTWTMSGLEISISRPGSAPSAVIGATPTTELAVAATETPTVGPTGTLIPASTEAVVETEATTLAAIATNAAETELARPTGTPVVTAPDTSTDAGVPTPEATEAPAAASASSEATTAPADVPTNRNLAASTNSYTLIPIEGEREIRPAEEHGDLNLKLRDPQPAEFEPTLVDIPNGGSDPHAPKLSAAFEPNFVATYAVHDWDWGCNCKGDLIQNGSSVLVGIKTSPGEPVFIPHKDQAIFHGKYYATLLYASEDSLTFVYTRRGNVVEGYTVHYLGLQTDPNLLALYRQSQGNELPGLTLDTPVGIATDELIVAIRDKGTFMDARSRLDWWE